MTKQETIQRRRARIRARIRGTALRPRLVVQASLARTSAQLIDDDAGTTLAHITEAEGETGTKIERARLVGQRLAEAAVKAGIQAIVFDRAGHPYHGRIKALAEGAREKGLKF